MRYLPFRSDRAAPRLRINCGKCRYHSRVDGRKFGPVRILLIYPEFPDTFWSFKHALKFIRKKAALPPLGLLTFAAMVPPEWEKRLVDTNIRRLRDKDLAWADVVCISAMIAQQASVRTLLARCRAAGKTILAGVPLFTSASEQFP